MLEIFIQNIPVPSMNHPQTLHYLIKNLQEYEQVGKNSSKFFKVLKTINHLAVLKMWVCNLDITNYISTMKLI